jgi:hypothetical protein
LLGSAADFVPPPGATQIALRAARGGDSAFFPTTLDLVPGVAPITLDRLAAVAVPVALLLAVLVFLAPTARLFSSIEREVRRVLGTGRGSGLSWREALILLGAVAVVIAPLSPRFVRERLDGISVVLLAVVADVALRAAVHPGSTVSSRVRQVLVAVGRIVAQAVPPLAAVLGAALVSGSVRIEGLVEAQGGAPWAWNALRSPMLAALAVLYVRHALPPVEVGAEPPSSAVRVAERMRLLALGALGTAAFLGGWQIPGVAATQLLRDPTLALAAGGVFAIKTWLLGLAIARARAPRAEGFAHAIGPASALAALGAAAALTALDPTRTTEALLAAATFSAAGTIGVLACARAALGRPLEPAPIVHPFN